MNFLIKNKKITLFIATFGLLVLFFAPIGVAEAFLWSKWNETRQPENNLTGAYLKAGDYLQKQINTKQETTKQEINNNNGYLNFKKCEDNKAAKKGDTSSCKTTTPGSLIQSGLQSTIDLGKKRLVDAGKIDQLITSITNALIKKALNTVLDKGQ